MVYKYPSYSLRMSSVLPCALVAVAMAMAMMKLRASLQIQDVPQGRPLGFPFANHRFYLRSLRPQTHVEQPLHARPRAGLERQDETHILMLTAPLQQGSRKLRCYQVALGWQVCVSWVPKEAKRRIHSEVRRRRFLVVLRLHLFL